jgi:hypothetical protein
MSLLPLLILASPAALAWPLRSAWIPVEQGAACGADPGQAYDPVGDVIIDQPSLDIVGEHCDDSPAVSWYLDESLFYLRLRLADSPEGDTGTWGALIESDGASYGQDLALLYDSGEDQLQLWSFPGSTGGWSYAAGRLEQSWPEPFVDRLVRIEEAGTSLGGDHDHFIDLAVSTQALIDTGQVLSSAPIEIYAATGQGVSGQLDADLASCDNGRSCSLATIPTVSITFDQDRDGLPYPAELDAGTDPADADSDDDGLLDADELALGTDPLLCDSDDDGLVDGLEAGVFSQPYHTQEPGCFQADTDPTTTTDPTNADTDGDGLNDGEEDTNADGAVGAWELDPNQPEGAADDDGDGIYDALEERCGGSDSTDRDGDTLVDASEGMDDPDLDGDPNFCDTDSDGDGWSDEHEAHGDSDGDGIPAFLDTDSDDDGVLDAWEEDGDGDCDGEEDRVDPWHDDGPCGDPDGDGVINGKEALCGTDPLDPQSYPQDPADCFGSDGEPPPDNAPQAPFSDGHFGGGCDNTGRLVPLALLLAGLLVLPRRRRTGRGWAAMVWLPGLMMISGRAHAQDLDAQLFHPTADQGVFIGLEDAAGTPQGLGAALAFTYAQNPFVYHYDDPSRPAEQVVGSLGTMDLVPWWRIGPARIALDLPLPLVASGSGITGPHWLGDVALDAKLLLLDRLEAPLGLALRARATAPTGNTEAWVGSGVPTATAELDLATGRRVVAAANLGVTTGNGTRLDELLLGPRMHWGLGLQAPLTDPITLVLEAHGSHLLRSLEAQGAHPIEALLGIRSRPVGPWVGSLGMGAGISHGLGAPSLRLVTGLAYVPRSPDAPPGLFVDHDRDGLVDEHDACPDQPEDFDGRHDRDGCPDNGQAPLMVDLYAPDGTPLAGGSLHLMQGDRSLDHWRLDDGSIIRSLPAGVHQLELSAPGHHALRFELELTEASAQRVLAQTPRRVAQGRGRDGGSSGGGDLDGDEIPAPRDACPDQPEDPNDQADDDGCPDGYLTATSFALVDSSGLALPSGRLMLVAGPVTGSWIAQDGALQRSLVPGDYLLVAQAEGYGSVEQELRVPEAAALAVTIELEPEGALAQVLLQIQDPSGRPLPARVWAQGPQELLRETDEHGGMELALPAGLYDLQVASPGYRAHRGPLELEPDSLRPVVLALEPLPPASEQASGLPTLLPRLIPMASGEPSPDEALALRALADSLRARPDVRVVTLEGWVPSADERSQPALRSLALAQGAKAWLVQHEAIAEHRLVAVGMGAVEAGEGSDRPAQGIEIRAAVLLRAPGGAVELER